jgi:hypothetical protein
MHVDFTGWDASRPGLVWGEYRFSKMGNARDTKLEVHFDIQEGLLAHVFVSFLFDNLDFPREMPVRVSLRPMDGNGPNVVLRMMGRPDDGGAVFGLANEEDTQHCLKVLLTGKHMHFAVDAVDGEVLVRLPLPNDKVFETIFRAKHAAVQTGGGQTMATGADPRTLALVILPKDSEDPTIKIVLMGLDAKGEIDWDKPNFVLARSTDLSGATNYAKGVADILRIKVLQLVNT